MGVALAVGVGGGIGALARYYIASWIQAAGSSFPWGIFVVNITGGLLMGMIVEASALKLNLSPELRSFLTVGILGGYTTFSTFSASRSVGVDNAPLDTVFDSVLTVPDMSGYL